MAPVARELSSKRGVLEPLQTARSLEGQVEELRSTLETSGDPPVVLIGFSWGAWLSYITAARYPGIVRKLILIASGPFEERYAANIHETRLSRLGGLERAEAGSLAAILYSPGTVRDKKAGFKRLGALFLKADAYDPAGSDESDEIDYDIDIFQHVWEEAAALRKNGTLLELGRAITCPVIALHGDFDPHPAAGVREPLSAVVRDFRFMLLENCGHKPWTERQARSRFYEILRKEWA